MSSPRFTEWREAIYSFCKENGYSFSKAEKLVNSFNRDVLFLQYHDLDKGKDGLRDETRMPLVLALYRDGEGVRIETTEYTGVYLSEEREGGEQSV